MSLLFVLWLTSPVAAEQTRAPKPALSSITIQVAARGLRHPWALQFLPDGRFLVTERPGQLRIVGPTGQVSAPIPGMPDVAATGQGGLLDLALFPDFVTSRRIAFSYAEPRSGGNGTTVATARLADLEGAPRLEDLRVIFRQQPAHSGGLHFGSRLVFASDGRLFVTLGERFQREQAQDLGNHWGKVVRLETDGRVPPDNPFFGRLGTMPEIWSYGHRNTQAAVLHPETGKLWLVEHGPRGGDEVNIAAAGRNYGWPVIGYGIDYSGARIHDSTHREGMEQPIYYWTPSIAPSGMAFYSGRLFPAWRGNLFVGALAGQALHRLVLDGEKVVAEEVLLADRRERIRDVRVGPDEALWLLTDETDGKLLRLIPAQ